MTGITRDGPEAAASADFINSLQDHEIHHIVHRWMAERRLREVVSQLNHDLRHGDPKRMEAARTAFRRIGFN